ncbi:tetratricopeptide repeat protein [Actinoplanes sp. NPDC026619]|uniref:tetratricopeptide repeat protein n=1 Tax=Actinoplanes sp. NPDC026619 TaxID=3155798 RepID=UPI0033C42D2A
MKTAPELWSLVGQAQDLPHGAAQIALVEQVLRRVDEAGDPELAFYARLLATTAYVYGGEPGKAFVPFSWCVADFDRNPAPYHQRWQHNLLWLFKTMVNALTTFHEVPLARTYAVLDDMERRYRETGHGMHAVYKHRYLVASHVGQTEEADAWFERWQSAQRDALSDCAGCDPTDVAKYLSSRDRFADAVALAEPVLSGELSCSEQPQGILRELTVPYLQTGELQKAADAHRRAYRLERGNLADLWNIGTHLGFCGRTGNEHRGLEMLQRHIDWLERAPSPAAEMNFAAEAAMLLRRLSETGHGELTVRRKDRADITVTELAPELAERALILAARFDARNGTGHQSELIAETINAQPYGIDLVLSPTARLARPETVRPEPEPALEVPAAADPAELLDLATEHFLEERPAALAATLTALDERFPVLADPLLAARRLAMIGNLLSWQGDETFAERWSVAADLFDTAGAESDAIVLRARAALARTQQGEPDPAPIQADVEHQEKNGDARGRANAWARLAVLHAVRDEMAEAAEAIGRCADYATESGYPRTVASHADLRARILANSDDRAGALAAARQAWEFYRVHGPAFRLAPIATVYGQLLDDPAGQIEAFGTAIATGDAGEVLPARIGRGRALKRADRAGDAIADLVEAVALCTEQGLVPGGAYARWELAEAYALAGRSVEAAEVAEEALLAFDELSDRESANNARFLLAKQYREIGDRAGAVSRYRELIEQLADNPEGRGQVGEEVGGLLFDLDRDAEAAEAFRAAGDALREAGDLLGELRTLRRRISALHYADDPAAAEETYRLAGERFAALPAELAAEPGAIWETGVTAFEQARMLMARDRHADAVPVLRDLPPRLRRIGAIDEADRLDTMYGEALHHSGDPAAAATHLRELLAAMAPESANRELAERILGEAEKS